MTTNTQLPHRAKVKVGRIRTTRTNEQEDDVGYNALAAAIVLQAIQDYKTALKCLRGKGPKVVYLDGSCTQDPVFLLDDVETFLRSPWYGVLCDIDPNLILKKLRYGR